MNFKERNYALLVVSASETFCSAIKEILAPYNGAFTARYEQNVAAAKRAAAETAFDRQRAASRRIRVEVRRGIRFG